MPPDVSDEVPADSVIQLRFSSEDGSISDLNAAEVAEVLQGLVQFTSQMTAAGLFESPVGPTVRVRPPKAGSFELVAVLQWAHENPAVAAAMVGPTTVGAVTVAIRVGTRLFRGVTAKDVERLDDGKTAKITWSDETVQEVPVGVWDRINKARHPTKAALRKIMAPLGDDATRLEIDSGREIAGDVDSPTMVLDRADYRAVAAADPAPADRSRTFETEATLLSVDFRRGEPWRIETRDGTRRTSRKATLEDESYQRELDNGLALGKNDLLILRIQEVETKPGERTTRRWSIVKVLARRAGGGDGDDGSPPGTAS